MVDYHSVKWTNMREWALRRDGYMCQLCKRYGKARPANTVHHIFPCEHFPQHEWEPWNLISVCGKCHNEMHDRDTHRLTAAGMELLRRTAQRAGVTVPGGYEG